MYSSLRIKGCDVIADALLRVRQQIPDLRILAFGAEIPSPEVPLVPGTEFTLRPPQESIRELYAACDVWVWGSRLEGFGLPIIEAMACRTPVVATDAGAAAALVAPGRGKLVPVQDSAAIASAVIEYCQMTADDWTKQSNAAYEFAQKRSLDVAAREFMTALESIVDGALTR
jgi:glycosyltransferase involved in cell wall biosynthesis